MSHVNNERFNEDKFQARQEWLADIGSNEDSVLSDEDGEYIIDEQDFTDGTDEGYVSKKKIYLPKEFQN